MLREFNHQNGVTVAYKAFYNRLAHAGFAKVHANEHIIDELVATLLASASITAVFRDGISFLLANARRATPKRDRKTAPPEWSDRH